MRVAGSDEVTFVAGCFELAWGDGHDHAWRESLRAHLGAAGSISRRALLDRVLRWHGAEAPGARERLDALLEDLDAIGDAYVGAGGLVGAAPPRAARVQGSTTALLLGSVPTSTLLAALSGESFTYGRVRRVVLTRHDPEALAAAMERIGGRVIDAAVWAGLDRTPISLGAWRDELLTRRAEDAAPDGDAEVFVPGPRGRWRRDVPEVGTPRLERFRQPGGWFRFAWRRGEGVVSLSSDEAARTVIALAAAAGHPPHVEAEPDDEGAITFVVPGWIPRAEYRLLLGSCDRVRTAEGGARLVAARGVWTVLATTLRERLGMTVDESRVLR